MPKKSLNMIEKMMDPNIIEIYIINCAIPSIITTKIVTKSILASASLRHASAKVLGSNPAAVYGLLDL